MKKLAHDSETVWLASDEDREGEAISWHLIEALGLDEKKTKRIAFHEITKTAIQEAIESPRAIDKHLVDAQQARRVLDRLVGFELSPLLWKKIKPSLSAGRVQSVAVRLIVEREEEIRNFKTTSAYRVIGDFLVNNGQKISHVQAELNKRFAQKEDAVAFLEKCKKYTTPLRRLKQNQPENPLLHHLPPQHYSRRLPVNWDFRFPIQCGLRRNFMNPGRSPICVPTL